MKKGGNHSRVFTLLTGQIRRSASGRRQSLAGFTIVETLIVLAVTSALFISAVIAINGRQAKTEFQTAINSVQQQIQQIINETASGYFPSSTTNCTGGGSTAQGTNTGCVFLGKVLEFGIPFGGDDHYKVYSLTGSQSALTLATANPLALPDTSSAVTKLQNGLMVAAPSVSAPISMSYTRPGGGSGGHTAGFAIISSDSTGSIAQSDASGLVSGSQQFSLWAIRGTQVGATSQAAMRTAIGTVASYDAANQVSICFSSGTTNQSGLVTIGANGSSTGGGLQVTLKIYGSLTCS